ncbi:MAG: hypothetical protein Kow00120_03470 [Anaerolineae bacterium]
MNHADRPPDFSGFTCSLPLRDYPQNVMGHGSGGRMSADLVRYLFGTLCTPQRPLGATMVSSEGACAAYYKYGRDVEDAGAPV